MPNRSFSKNPDYDFEIRCTLGAAQAGGADVGEVLAAVAGIKAKDHEGWFDAWTELSLATAAAAEDAAKAGHTVTAAGAYLRAAHYYSVAVNAASALAGSEELLPTFRRHRAAWEGFVDNAPVPVERVSIPYGRAKLPGYFFSPSGPKKARPTLIMSNGSDGAISGMWSQGGAAALARGYNFLCLRRPRPAVDAVREGHAVPPRLGGRDHAGRRLPAGPPRRREAQARDLGHQPGRLLGPARDGLRAPDSLPGSRIRA